MAHSALTVLGFAAMLVGCGAYGASDRAASKLDAPSPRLLPGLDAGPWGTYHSRRFAAQVPLPDGRAWRIDDRSEPWMVAVHDKTSSRLKLATTIEPEVMNRARCEERARRLGWVPARPLATVEDEVTVGPDAFDSRVWVALDASAGNGPIDGHVFSFGAFIRRCLLVHVTTRVPSPNDSAALSARLALIRERIVRRIATDPLRTTDDATLPREPSKTTR